MKKFITLILTVGLYFPVLGQNATAILDAVNKKYSGFSSYIADFKIGNQNATLISKGKKYKISYGGQEVYNNGKDVYTYLEETNEVNITSYRVGDESDLSPNNIFNLYKKGYNASYKQSKTLGGKKYDVVTLSPKSKSSITKIEMTIGSSDKMIHSWTVYEGKGTTTYTITKFSPNVNISDATFTFDKKKYPKVEIIDLR